MPRRMWKLICEGRDGTRSQRAYFLAGERQKEYKLIFIYLILLEPQQLQVSEGVVMEAMY